MFLLQNKIKKPLVFLQLSVIIGIIVGKKQASLKLKT
jgi:hypothetical protein